MRVALIFFAFAAFLSACETLKGVGRDVEAAGEALDKAIDD